MENNKLFRTAGWCALASAICLPLAMVSFMLSGTAPIAGMVGMIFEVISLLLLVFVFYELSVAHRSESKWLGFAGMIIMVVAIVVDVVSQQINSTFLFGLWYLLYSVPFLIFGYLAFRSDRMPRGLAVLVLLAGVITFIAGVVGLLGNPGLADSIQTFSIPFSLAWEIWLWRVLVSKKFTAAKPEPAVAGTGIVNSN
jgi:hypothetical protein